MLVWMIAGLIILGNSGKNLFSGKGINVNPIGKDKAEIFGREWYKYEKNPHQSKLSFIHRLLKVFPLFFRDFIHSIIAGDRPSGSSGLRCDQIVRRPEEPEGRSPALQEEAQRADVRHSCSFQG